MARDDRPNPIPAAFLDWASGTATDVIGDTVPTDVIERFDDKALRDAILEVLVDAYEQGAANGCQG